MPKKYINHILLIFIIISSITVFFYDGYLDWINSDTAAEAYGISQDVRFPQGLFSDKPHHSRITGHWLSYVPFHVIGGFYSFIFNDPVESLYVSQGVMSSILFTLFILISSSYISLCSNKSSKKYILSSFIVLSIVLLVPSHESGNLTFGIAFRFNHQAVMTNYLGTMVIALIALFPYWRYILTGKWDDICGSCYKKIIFYMILVAAQFSSTATTLWLTLFSIVVQVAYVTYFIRKEKMAFLSSLKNLIIRNKINHSIIFLFFAGVISIFAESTSSRGSTVLLGFDLVDYLHAYFAFFYKSQILYLFLIFMTVILLFHRKRMLGNNREEINILLTVFPWLILVNLLFVFFIGMPKIPFRFEGYNLGRDTTFFAAWSVSILIISIIINSIKIDHVFKYSIVVLFVCICFSITTFKVINKPAHDAQRAKLNSIQKFDKEYKTDTSLFLRWFDLGFSREDCEESCIPMLKSIGIINPRRKVVVF